jgi:hypothetical protein
MNNKDKFSDKFSLNIKVTEEENDIIKTLRDKYAVNISKLLKNYLRTTLDEFEKKK